MYVCMYVRQTMHALKYVLYVCMYVYVILNNNEPHSQFNGREELSRCIM